MISSTLNLTEKSNIMDKKKSKKDVEDHNPELSEDMIVILLNEIKRKYIPAFSPESCDEMKSHVDLIEEFETFSPVDPDRLFRLMQLSGFHLHYTGDGFYWLLKSV